MWLKITKITIITSYYTANEHKKSFKRNHFTGYIKFFS